MKRFLHSGIISFIIILAVQVGVFASLTLWLNEYSKYIIEMLYMLGAVLVIYEINRPSEPSFKYAWIVIITVLPIFGGLFYIYTHLNVITKTISNRTDVMRTMHEVQKENEGITIKIGSEMPGSGFEDCSIITSRYKIGDSMEGVIGLIGPTRMDYKKAVSVLKSTTDLLSKRMTEMQEE